MAQHLAFLLLGLSSGAVFAALALGLVLSYRSSGVVNFATGAIALYGAYSYSLLRQGRLLVLVPGLPVSVDIGSDPGLAVSMAIAVLMTAVLGTLLYLCVFRFVRTAPPVAKAVIALGVMVLLQTLFANRLGTKPITVEDILPRHVWSLGDARLASDRLYFALIVVLVAGALAVALRRTRFGAATRAAADSEKGAIVTGLSPDRIAVANWALSSAVAGLGGILIAPIVPLTPSGFTLMIVPALAAALVANLRTLMIATGAALLVGMAQSEATYLQVQHSWIPQHGVAEVIPLVIILAFLLARGRALPERGELIVRTLGRAPRPRRLAPPLVVGTVVGVIAVLVTSGGYRGAVTTTMILAIIALSLVVVTGYAGQVSFAQLTLAGAGAFLLNRFGHVLGIPFPIAPLLAAVGAAVVGVVVGLPALRVRGLPVAIVTLALAVGLDGLWFRNPDLTGGVTGAVIDPPSLFGVNLGPGGGSEFPRMQFALLCLVLLLAVAIGVALLRRSRLGSAMLAVRANERAAAAMGIDVARTKITAFAIGSFIAGIGGCLMGYQQTLASPDVYSPFAGFALFAIVYLAGITSITGAVLAGIIASGGIVYVVLNHLTSNVGEWFDLVVAAGLVVQVVRLPEGAAAGLHELADRFDRRGAGAAPAVARRAMEDHPADRPPVAPGPPALVIQDLSVQYGSVIAVRDTSITVPRGLIVGLIGPNGAGKTTVIDAVSGFAPCTGRVTLGDRRIDGLPPHRRTREGLGRTFQALELWDDLSVLENVGAREPLELLGLEAVAERPVRELSQGERQLVSIARSLATRPEVLLLDEPAGGLDSSESMWLGARLRDVRASGVTIVLVDHDMGLVLDVCDEIHVLDLGEVIASGTPAQIRTDPVVATAYLGTSQPAGSEVS